MRKGSVIAFVILLWAAILGAVSVVATVEKSPVNINENIVYIITVISDTNPNLSPPPAPQVDGLTFLSMASSLSTSTSVINLRRSVESRTSFRYSFRAQRTGSFTFPSSELRVSGRSYRVNSVNVQVSTAPSIPTPQGSWEDDSFWDHGSLRGSDTYVLPIPEKTSCYVGEPLIVSYYIYTNQELTSLVLEDEKDHTGYGKIAYDAPKELKSESVTHNGKRMRRALIHRLAILPNTTGRMQLPTLTVKARILSFLIQEDRHVSKDLHITAYPLPETGKPKDFSGAIGSFTISESLSGTDVSQGEALIYSLKIKGKGNFNQFTAPQYPTQDKVQISAPFLSDNLVSGIYGERTISYTIIPQIKGELKLSGVRFNWFDVESGSYKSFQTTPRTITVNPGSLLSELFRSNTPLRILPLIPGNVGRTYQDPLHQSWFWIVFAFLATLIIGSGVWAYTKSEKYRDPELFAQRQAEKILSKYLEAAQSAVKEGSQDFYSLAEIGLMRFVCHRFKIPYGLSLKEKIQLLAALPQNQYEELDAFFQRCEQARFMPIVIERSDLIKDWKKLETLVQSLLKVKPKALITQIGEGR